MVVRQELTFQEDLQSYYFKKSAANHLLPIDKFTVVQYIDEVINRHGVLMNVEGGYDETQIASVSSALVQNDEDGEGHDVHMRRQWLVSLFDIRDKLEIHLEDILHDYTTLRTAGYQYTYLICKNDPDITADILETLNKDKVRVEARFEKVIKWCRFHLYRIGKMEDCIRQSDIAQELGFERDVVKNTWEYFSSTYLKILNKQIQYRAIQTYLRKTIDSTWFETTLGVLKFVWSTSPMMCMCFLIVILGGCIVASIEAYYYQS